MTRTTEAPPSRRACPSTRRLRYPICRQANSEMAREHACLVPPTSGNVSGRDRLSAYLLRDNADERQLSVSSADRAGWIAGDVGGLHDTLWPYRDSSSHGGSQKRLNARVAHLSDNEFLTYASSHRRPSKRSFFDATSKPTADIRLTWTYSTSESIFLRNGILGLA